MNILKQLWAWLRTVFQFGRNSLILGGVSESEIEETGGGKIEEIRPIIIPVRLEFDLVEKMEKFCKEKYYFWFDKFNIFSLRSPLDDDRFNCVFLLIFRKNVGDEWEHLITASTTRPSRFYLDPENVRKFLGKNGYAALKMKGQHVNKFSIGPHRGNLNHLAFRQDLGPIPMKKMIGPEEYEDRTYFDYYCSIHHGKDLSFVGAQGGGCTVIQTVEAETRAVGIGQDSGLKSFTETILDGADASEIYRYCKDKIKEAK